MCFSCTWFCHFRGIWRKTFWDKDVCGDADPRQQERPDERSPPSDDVEEEVDRHLRGHLDRSVDEVSEKHVQSKPGDVQADPVVRGGHSKPAEHEERWALQRRDQQGCDVMLTIRSQPGDFSSVSVAFWKGGGTCSLSPAFPGPLRWRSSVQEVIKVRFKFLIVLRGLNKSMINEVAVLQSQSLVCWSAMKKQKKWAEPLSLMVCWMICRGAKNAAQMSNQWLTENLWLLGTGRMHPKFHSRFISHKLKRRNWEKTHQCHFKCPATTLEAKPPHVLFVVTVSSNMPPVLI